MSISLTGEEFGVSEYETPGSRITQNTDVHEARCQHYDLHTEKSGVMRVSRIREAEHKTKALAEHKVLSQRYAVRHLTKEAQKESSRMLEAAQGQDAMETASAGMALSDALGSLWQRRSVRDDEWASLLSFLQAAIAKEEFEQFTVEQCQAVANVIDSFLAGPAVRDEDVTRAREILQKSGLDPWKGISSQ